MKKYFLILCSILTITSCDIVEGPYITDSDSYINTDKKVLIEDFTGHLCTNCPEAAREISAIHDLYGDQIIALAIHVSADYARPKNTNPDSSYHYDFRTEWGEEWDNIFGASAIGLPRGMVNRIGGQSPTLGKNEWASSVANELKKEIDFKISIEADTNEITIASTLENTLDNDYNLVVCLTESNVINWQADGQNNIEDYQHNHVLRSVVYDDKISNQSTLTRGAVVENTFNINIKELEQYNILYSNNIEAGNGNSGGWNTNNMSVIAYIYNNITNEIVQVEEVPLNN